MAFSGKTSARVCTMGAMLLMTCTFSLMPEICQPFLSSSPCSFGNCCLSLAASAAFGVASTSWPPSNCRMSQCSNIAGKALAQSFCRAARRVTVGIREAIVALPRRKSVAPVTAGPERAKP